MRSVFCALILALCASCASSPPVIVVGQPQPGDESMRMGAMLVRDAAGVQRTYRTTELSGEHLSHTIPSDAAGNTIDVLSSTPDSVPITTNALNTAGLTYIYDGTDWDRLRGDATYGAYVDVTRLPTFPVHPYVESLVLEPGDTSDDLTSTAIDLRGYAEVWVELALGPVAATGEIVVTVSNDADDVVDAAHLSTRWPIYGLLATTGADTCTQTADGDTEVDVTAIGDDGEFRCAFRIPRGPAYAAIRWIAGTGGGAGGIVEVRVLRRAY